MNPEQRKNHRGGARVQGEDARQGAHEVRRAHALGQLDVDRGVRDVGLGKRHALS